MTTVVGYAGHGGLVMVADTKTNVYDRPVYGGARKIMRLSVGDVTLLVGVSGNAGMPGRIRAAWRNAGVAVPPVGDVDELQEWAEDVAGLLTQAMLDAAMVDSDGQMDGHFLLGVPGRLWTVYHFAAIPHDDGKAGVGTGAESALASLEVLLPGLEPEAAVVQAAEIAVSRDIWSGLPLQVEVLDPVAASGAPGRS